MAGADKVNVSVQHRGGAGGIEHLPEGIRPLPHHLSPVAADQPESRFPLPAPETALQNAVPQIRRHRLDGFVVGFDRLKRLPSLGGIQHPRDDRHAVVAYER